MSNITEKEKGLIEKLRESVRDLKLNEDQNDDRILIRWIRGRNHDLAKAEEALRVSMEYRMKHDFQNIANWKAPENLQKECPIMVPGLDRQGSPVICIPLGSWDLKKLAAAGQKDNVLKHVDQFFERHLGKPSPNGSTQMTQIIDMDNYSLRQFSSSGAVDIIMEMMKRVDMNYPEILKCGIILNASKVFSMLFALIKPVMGRQATMMNVFSAGSEKGLELLHDKVPLESIPTKFGGKNEEAQRVLYGK